MNQIDEILIYTTHPYFDDTDGDELIYWGKEWNSDPDGDSLINILDIDSDNDGNNDGI